MNHSTMYERLFGVHPLVEAGCDASLNYNHMYPTDQLGIFILDAKDEVEWLVSHSTTNDDGARCWSF